MLAQIPRITLISALIYPEGGAQYTSLLVGMTRNDVMVNIRGGATCNNNKQFNHVPLAKSLFKFCNDTAP